MASSSHTKRVASRWQRILYPCLGVGLMLTSPIFGGVADLGHADPVQVTADPAIPYIPPVAVTPMPGVPRRAPVVALPVITPQNTGWQPKYPFPFDKMRNEVTPADITAGDEMCQWFSAQYYPLIDQIEALHLALAGANGNYGAAGVQATADIVAANIDQSVDYLAPRAQALTQNVDYAGDIYFPMYQAVNFYKLWQQLSNISIGIKSHHVSWDFGPVVKLAEHYGGGINASHICR